MKRTESAEGIGLTDALVRLSLLVNQIYTDVGRELDLTPQQTQLLCRLMAGPIGMGELGRAMHLEKSSLTGLVDRVERRSLVERLPDSQDRRACRIALTRAGSRLATDAHDAVTAGLEALSGELGPTDRKRLVATATRILAADTAATGRVWIG